MAGPSAAPASAAAAGGGSAPAAKRQQGDAATAAAGDSNAPDTADDTAADALPAPLHAMTDGETLDVRSASSDSVWRIKRTGDHY